MKKFLILILLIILQPGWAQKRIKKDLLQLEKNVYDNAVKNYDINVAKNAVYRIIELEGEQSSYLDTLAYIYMNEKNYLSCLKVSEKILKKQEKLPVLELKAISLENLQAYKEAIETYEKIYKLKKEPYVAYKLAFLQQKIKRSAEAYTTLKGAEKLTFPEKAYITFPGAKKNEVQNVPFKAAFYHLLAMTSYDLHNYEMASKYFEEALKIFPEFYVAKQNKQAIDLMVKKLQSGSNQPADNNPKK